MVNGKTVFILGAGFSIPSGAPSQGSLIQKIFELENHPRFKKKQNQVIENHLKEFKKFVTDNLFVSAKKVRDLALEDIFTPLDRCIIDNISFRGIEPNKLIETRENLYTLIAAAITTNIYSAKKSYVTKFVSYLIKEASIRTKKPKKDTVAVISTNWDIILDNELQNQLNALKKEGEDFEGVVDYCCYMSSLKEDEKIKPGLYALGKGKFNVKLLKLHGSMNWHTCPRCQRLYVDFYKTFQGLYLINNHYCRHCQRNFDTGTNHSAQLRTNLIMPTFLKDLNNFQIKSIWQNSGIELSEAAKVVFIGYSLPQADFELRQLLSRMLRKDVKIEVVLCENDKPKMGFENYSADYRYKTFFSGAKLKFSYDGVEDYINNTFDKK